jgi:hypothetical protein
MPRSVGIFRKVGFDVEPYPVDWRTGRGGDLLKFSDRFAERLALVDTAAREWIGLIAYWITGKTSEFFPVQTGADISGPTCSSTFAPRRRASGPWNHHPKSRTTA